MKINLQLTLECVNPKLTHTKVVFKRKTKGCVHSFNFGIVKSAKVYGLITNQSIFPPIDINPAKLYIFLITTFRRNAFLY